MNYTAKNVLILLSVLLLVAGSGWLLYTGIRKSVQTGEAGSQVWFYDESEKKLYPAPSATLPPDRGIGGKDGDGVRAVVVAFPGEETDPKKHRIAFLETYGPLLAELLRQARENRNTPATLPSRESPFFQTNTLVRLRDDHSWHIRNTEEGQRIVNQWRSWKGLQGQSPVPVVP